MWIISAKDTKGEVETSQQEHVQPEVEELTQQEQQASQSEHEVAEEQEEAREEQEGHQFYYCCLCNTKTERRYVCKYHNS